MMFFLNETYNYLIIIKLYFHINPFCRDCNFPSAIARRRHDNEAIWLHAIRLLRSARNDGKGVHLFTMTLWLML